MLLLELVQMNCASSERVTIILEESFFTSNDVVLAGKNFQRVNTEPFLKNFKIFEDF